MTQYSAGAAFRKAVQEESPLQVVGAINASPDAGLIDKPGGIFLRRIENLSEEDKVLFQSVARIVLSDTAETLREQVERRYTPRRLPAPLQPAPPPYPSQTMSFPLIRARVTGSHPAASSIRAWRTNHL